MSQNSRTTLKAYLIFGSKIQSPQYHPRGAGLRYDGRASPPLWASKATAAGLRRASDRQVSLASSEDSDHLLVACLVVASSVVVLKNFLLRFVSQWLYLNRNCFQSFLPWLPPRLRSCPASHFTALEEAKDALVLDAALPPLLCSWLRLIRAFFHVFCVPVNREFDVVVFIQRLR